MGRSWNDDFSIEFYEISYLEKSVPDIEVLRYCRNWEYEKRWLEHVKFLRYFWLQVYKPIMKQFFSYVSTLNIMAEVIYAAHSRRFKSVEDNALKKANPK